ncbi:EF-hand domain-containing protein [uncultured Sphingomonas sp.]|uniref:EF-hand domain-containing protein n=1 Tax=uncultured Sphingomonas sp. TaxID=158754 RepID=UPI0035C95F16
MSRPSSLIFLAPLFVVAPALAQETQATAAARFSREFAATDLNKDGAWTKPEIAARLGRMRAGTKKPDPINVKRLTDLWFGRADLNKNGKVTEAEAQGLLAAVFQRYDANKDGRIGGGERAAAKSGVQGR